jgi:hypothetical protein
VIYDYRDSKKPVEPDKPEQNGELNKWLTAFPIDKYPNGVEDVKNELKNNKTMFWKKKKKNKIVWIATH